MLFRIITVLALLGIGSIYHYHGMNDWFSPNAVADGVTLAQATNEVIASINFVAAMVLTAVWYDKSKDND